MTDEELSIRLASAGDEPTLRALLATGSLFSADLSTARQEYLLVERAGKPVGCIGLERAGESGLLRSFAVAPEHQARGVGTLLFARMLALARERGVRGLYLLTATAERYFLARGFERIDRWAVPAAIASTEEFRGSCCATAACLMLLLEGMEGDSRPRPRGQELTELLKGAT